LQQLRTHLKSCLNRKNKQNPEQPPVDIWAAPDNY